MGILKAGTLAGYALGWRGSFADHLGPWMAAIPTPLASCWRLSGGLFARDADRDCMREHAAAGDLAESSGFSHSRPLIRMFLRLERHPGRPRLLCAILDPEFTEPRPVTDQQPTRIFTAGDCRRRLSEPVFLASASSLPGSRCSILRCRGAASFTKVTQGFLLGFLLVGLPFDVLAGAVIDRLARGA